MTPLALFALSACLAIDAPDGRIVAADLARALPEWSALPPATPIGFAPAPGIQRVLRAAELRRLSAQWKIPGEPGREVCFVRPVAVIPPERMLEVMRRQLPEARIELIDSSRVPAPDGVIEFPLSGLRSGYWYGHVIYGAAGRFSIWARVNVTAPIKRVVAAADLRPGSPVAASQLTQAVIWSSFPAGSAPLVASPEEIAGFIARRAIPAGTAIRKDWLEPPKLIQKGDTVKVEVINGGAKLELAAHAQAPGALGEFIMVENPDSHRRFRARVEAAGKVSVKGVL